MAIVSNKMVKRNPVFAIVIFFIIWLTAYISDCNSQPIILAGSSSSWREKYAAEELAKYARLITGENLKVIKENSIELQEQREIILVGENKITEGLLNDNFPREELGRDGFIVKTIASGETCYLIFLGGSDIGTLYAVYHYLENICHVGFFEDGEHIPKLDSIPAKNLDIVEKPYFPNREAIQGCAYGYSAAYWKVEDWKREIDWLVKKKFNLIQFTIGQEPVWEKVYSQFGVDYKPFPQNHLFGPYMWHYDLTDFGKWESFEKEMVEEVVTYARERGVRTISPGYMGRVAEEFRNAYPEGRYMEVKWGGFTFYYIYPSAPMFERVGVAFLKEYNKTYGTDNLYNVDPYPEMVPGDTPEEKESLKISAAIAMANVIKKADPQGRWAASGWAFWCNPGYWPKESVKAFLDAVPDNMLLVNDVYAEVFPIYKKLDYLFGKEWGFGILHSFAGNATLHGDLADLIRRVKEVVKDPKAKKCTNFYINPEIIEHNWLYFDLATKLAWNPQEIELKTFLQDYAIRRYGIKDAPVMQMALEELAQSVYSTNDLVWSYPFYQCRLGGAPFPGGVENREVMIPHLKKALEIAINASESQSQNQLYMDDLVDMGRQYLGELFNVHLIKLYEAFQRKDEKCFVRERHLINIYFDNLEKILSSNPRYCFQPILNNALKFPGAGAGIVRKAREAKTTLGSYDALDDYARKDLFELVKYHYRVRADFFFDTLNKKMMSGVNTFDFERDFKQELDPAYRKMAEEFVENGYQVSDKDFYKMGTISATRELLAAIHTSSTLPDHLIMKINRMPEARSQAKLPEKPLKSIGELKLYKDDKYWYLTSKESLLIIEESTGMIYNLKSMIPAELDILPPTQGGLVIYIWNDQYEDYIQSGWLDWVGVFNKVLTYSTKISKKDGDKYIQFNCILGLDNELYSDLVQAELSYTLFEDRLNVKVKINYLKNDISGFQI